MDVDLNRAWLPDRVARMRNGNEPTCAEDTEVREIDAAIEAARADAQGSRVRVRRAHPPRAGGPPFITLDDTLPNRAFGFAIPVTHVLGLEEELAGTMLSHMIAQDLTAIGYESGQHDDPASVDRAEAAIWLALEAAGVLEPGVRPEPAQGRKILAEASAGLPSVVEVRYRQPVEDDDDFAMKPGFESFQRVVAGQELAFLDGEVLTAGEPGRILMPLYQEQGRGRLLHRASRAAALVARLGRAASAPPRARGALAARRDPPPRSGRGVPRRPSPRALARPRDLPPARLPSAERTRRGDARDGAEGRHAEGGVSMTALSGPEDLEIQRFEALQARLADQFRRVFPDPHVPRTVVVVPSLSIDADVLAKIRGVQHYEERMLCLLMLLRMPRTNVIYVSSMPIDPVIVDYYLHFLHGVPTSHARRRLTMLACHGRLAHRHRRREDPRAAAPAPADPRDHPRSAGRHT